jgi:hypothetical protein
MQVKHGNRLLTLCALVIDAPLALCWQRMQTLRALNFDGTLSKLDVVACEAHDALKAMLYLYNACSLGSAEQTLINIISTFGIFHQENGYES